MTSITIQANKIKGNDIYKLCVSTNDVIENAILIEITKEDLDDICYWFNK